MSTNVYWNIYDPITPNSSNYLVLTHFDPEPILPYIIKNRERPSDANTYTTCPAFLDYHKNTYVIRSPVDIQFKYDPKSGQLNISPQSQDFYDSWVMHRGNYSPFLMSFGLYYLFIADQDCMVEQTPVTFHDNVVSSKIRLISGTFNIGKWFRPIDFGFEFLDESQPLIIKRGDPLYYLRFVPKDNKKINLVKRKMSNEIHTSVESCINVKKGLTKQPLKVLYSLAEKLRPKVTKKCPFNWRNK